MGQALCFYSWWVESAGEEESRVNRDICVKVNAQDCQSTPATGLALKHCLGGHWYHQSWLFIDCHFGETNNRNLKCVLEDFFKLFTQLPAK